MGGWGIASENSHTQMNSNVADTFISVYPDCGYDEFPVDSKANLALGQCGASTLSPKVWKNEPCTGMDDKWWEAEFVDVDSYDFRPMRNMLLQSPALLATVLPPTPRLLQRATMPGKGATKAGAGLVQYTASQRLAAVASWAVDFNTAASVPKK